MRLVESQTSWREIIIVVARDPLQAAAQWLSLEALEESVYHRSQVDGGGGSQGMDHETTECLTWDSSAVLWSRSLESECRNALLVRMLP